MPTNVISERPSADKIVKEVRIETQRTRGVDPAWELWETAGGKLCRMRLEPSDGSVVFETNDGVGGGWVSAGVVMVSTTSTAVMAFVIDEDNMVSDLDTKVPTQQSVKAYVDSSVAAFIIDGGSPTSTYTLLIDGGTP